LTFAFCTVVLPAFAQGQGKGKGHDKSEARQAKEQEKSERKHEKFHDKAEKKHRKEQEAHGGETRFSERLDANGDGMLSRN
jgi:hypothetical protein